VKKLIKKTTALLLVVSMLFASVTNAYARSAEDFHVVPLRAVLEEAGAFVDWVDGLAIIIMPNGDRWVFTPGAGEATLNSEAVPLSRPVLVVNGVSFIAYADLQSLFDIDAPAHEETAATLPEGEFALTTLTAMELAPAFMDTVGVTGLTMAVVDVETGFTWTQGFGYADSVRGALVDEHTLFQVGSTSKPFTAIAVMQLVEQGLINLDAPVVNYIPEFSMLPSPVLGGDSNDITVRMLLTNTSGIVRDKLHGWLITGNEHYQGHTNNLLDWLQTRELIFPPGAAYDYSNNNWTLLSIIVARVLGFDNYFEGFVEHTNATIFEPLGMNRSTFELTAGLTNVAMPYVTLGNQDVMHNVSPLAAGSLFSSAYEMARFMHTIGGNGNLDGHQLLPQSALNYMMREHSVMVPGVMGYGLGFIRVHAGEHLLVGHGGNISHYHTEMLIDSDTGIGVFVSTNTVSGILIASSLALAVMEAAITEKTGNAPVFAVEPPAGEAFALSEEELATLAVFEGLYSFGELGVWEMAITDGVLTWTSGEISFELTPLADGTFDSLAGNYAFEMIDGAPTATLTAGDDVVVGVKFDATDEIPLPEGFSDWVGVYNFVPQVANEAGLVTQIVISINAHGAPSITITQPIHTYLGTTEAPLGEYNGYWFVGTMPLRFILDDNGNRSIDLMGGIFVKQ